MGAAGLPDVTPELLYWIELERPDGGPRLVLEPDDLLPDGWIPTWLVAERTPMVENLSVQVNHDEGVDTPIPHASLRIDVPAGQSATETADELWPVIDWALKHFPSVTVANTTQPAVEAIPGCLAENPLPTHGALYEELATRALADC